MTMTNKKAKASVDAQADRTATSKDSLGTARAPLHGSRIEDYAMIGDCETAALVSRSGSIDWLCWPNFSSGACFASLLGTAENGMWSIAPAEKVVSIRRRYLPQTMVLETTVETENGVVEMLDFMPPGQSLSRLIRLVKGVRGKVKMHMDLVVRFDYGLTIPWASTHKGTWRAVAGSDMVVLHTTARLQGRALTTISDFTLRAGDTQKFCLEYTSALADIPKAPKYDGILRDTVRFWTDWMKRSTYRGEYQEIMERSLLTLKALTYQPTGGIVAAPTSSLPEWIGAERNWDYRYCWLRDTAFTLLVLISAGYEEEARAWRRWLVRAVAGAPDRIQTMYGIRGERLLNEWTADWLPGYEHSQPVRIGNEAAAQFQLDVFGEVASALLRMPEADKDFRVDAGSVEAQLIDHLCTVWQDPDQGIWESRGPNQHFVYSKVMAWVALDRAIRHHKQFDGAGNVRLWKKNRDMIRKEVLEKGFNKELNSFTQFYGSTTLDASCLRLVLVGFLPPDDPRIIGTVDAIERRLMKDGLVLRYDTEGGGDGLAGGEGAFLACSFWFASNLYLIGRKQQAREFFGKLVALSNDVGLLSEEYDPVGRRMLGNFPQALSHIALAHTAFILSDLWQPSKER